MDDSTQVDAAHEEDSYLREKRLAEAALRRLCLGAELVGLWWPGFPSNITLEIGDNPFKSKDPHYARYNRKRPHGSVWLGVADRWAVLAAAPPMSATEEQAVAEQLPEQRTASHLYQLIDLRDETIVAIRLGVAVAHLIVEFASGRALFALGDHPRFESWELSLGAAWDVNTDSGWQLISLPGGDIAVWAPDDFDPNFDAP